MALSNLLRAMSASGYDTQPSSGYGNTGIMGTGMTARRRNGRPDTSDEIAADSTQAPWWQGNTTNVWDLPAPYPGNNLGSNDFSRYGSNLGNEIFNSLGQFTNLSPQIAAAYQQLLSGTTPSTISGPISEMQQYLAGLIDPMASKLEGLMAPTLARGVSAINAAAMTGNRQAEDTLPAGGLVSEAKMANADSAMRNIAGLYGQAHDALFNPLAAAMGGNISQTGNAYAGGLGGMLSSALGAGGPETLLQRGLAPWSIAQGLYQLYNQGRGLEYTKDAAKGK